MDRTGTRPAPATTGATSSGAQGYRGSLQALLAAQKPPTGTAAYSRLINRPLGRRVAAAGHQVGLTPNGATAISAAMSATALALLVLVEPSAVLGAAVAVLLAGGYVMDSVDGQLARLRGAGSLAGEWLDHTVDCVKESAVHLAVLVAWYRFLPYDAEAWLVVPLLYTVVATTTYFGLILLPFLRARRPAAPDAPSSREGPLRKWLLLPHDYGTLAWSFVLLAWWPAFVAAYTALAAANGAALLLALRKWWRELRALDASAARV